MTPKYKPTKWKIDYCTNCKKIIKGSRWEIRQHKDHNVIGRPNVPFKIPDLKVTGHYSWIRAESKKLKEQFEISPTEVTRIIMGPGIEPGGLIPGQWWMWTKKGASMSLKWLEVEDGDAKV